jgi:UDP-glucose 4-epimerase
MKIAVTGSSGFIGRHLTKKLRLAGHQVAGLDVADGVDITNTRCLESVDPFEVCIHLAGRSYIPDSYAAPRDFFHTNIVGTLNMLELCRRLGARMIFTSCYVYGHPHYLPIDEKHPLDPLNPYAQSKRMAEVLCDFYHRSFGVPVVVFRPFNIYGKGQNENFLIPTILRQAREGIIRLKDPRPRRDYLYIDDLVEAYLRALGYRTTPFEIFNVGYGRSFSISEIVEVIARVLRQRIDIVFSGEERPNEIFDTVADIAKAAERLGFAPLIDLETGILEMMKD